MLCPTIVSFAILGYLVVKTVLPGNDLSKNLRLKYAWCEFLPFQSPFCVTDMILDMAYPWYYMFFVFSIMLQVLCLSKPWRQLSWFFEIMGSRPSYSPIFGCGCEIWTQKLEGENAKKKERCIVLWKSDISVNTSKKEVCLEQGVSPSNNFFLASLLFDLPANYSIHLNLLKIAFVSSS